MLFYHFERFVAEYESRFEREHGFFRPIVKEVVERRCSLCPWTRPSRISPGPRASERPTGPQRPPDGPGRPKNARRGTNSPSPVSQAGVGSVKIELIRHSPHINGPLRSPTIDKLKRALASRAASDKSAGSGPGRLACIQAALTSIAGNLFSLLFDCIIRTPTPFYGVGKFPAQA